MPRRGGNEVLRATIGKFDGMHSDLASAKLPVSVHQIDSGSRTLEGSWEPRRGMTPANVTGKSAAIYGVVAFDTQDGDIVAVVADTSKLYSEAAFDDDIAAAEEGFGEGGFGEGGFGA